MNPKSSNFGNETYSAAAMLDCGELLAHQEANDESSPRISTERESSSQAGDSLPENPHGRPGTKDGPFPFPRWKRIFDITVVLLTLPCWFPLMVLVCLGIRIVSWGPVFFVQERVGYRAQMNFSWSN